MEYDVEIKAISSLIPAEIQEIVALYMKYYGGTSESLIRSDLTSKSEIMLLFYRGQLIGFTTYEIYTHRYHNQDISIIYSGDTIVHHKHWGQQSLAFAWIRRIVRLKKSLNEIPLYWFLIVKGHRTYKFLPAFTKSFYPHWSIDRSDLKPLLDRLAEEKFGEAYDGHRGIISFETTKGYLKHTYATPQENEISNPAVAFFLRSNPGYQKGDELACLCEFDNANLRSFTKRIVDSYDKVE